MTNVKALSAVIILSAAVATPVFAKEHGRASYAVPETRERRSFENFGFSGSDRSWVGGEDPSLHPSGN
jgi:hypothetical protein